MTESSPVHETLQNLFGFSSFRPHQEEIVGAVMDGRDAFVVMPTGGGKSLCYQLPARLLPGTCIVISPLISLMKDQVDAANELGLESAYLNSSQPGDERRRVSDRLIAGKLDLLYVSPERLAMDHFIDALERTRLAFIAIDEAHCISEWGHDFRPDYLTLARLTEWFPELPITAFTATATRKVQDDIVERLRLRRPHVVRASFNRPNLYYNVRSKEQPERQILDFVRQRSGESGIIYRTTRKSVNATAAMLIEHGIRARPYHAGLEDDARAAAQDAFNRDVVDVVVATIAFGMGIDKSNVRFVLHGDLPKSIEGYYQETGRAGRDGEPAHCLLLFGRGDISKVRFFIDSMEDEEERQRALRCLNDMASFASVHACRRKRLLGYFDETFDEASCGACDVCCGDVEKIDGTRDAQIVLSAMVRTGERFGINHIVDVVCGADTQRIRDLRHDQLKTYGVGNDRPKRHWRMVIDNLLGQEIVAQSDGSYPVLILKPNARDVLSGGAEVSMLKTAEPRVRRASPGLAGQVSDGSHDETLFQTLRELRRQLATEQEVPPYIVFSDRTLREMASALPRTDTELLQVTGVGETKLARYGAAFLAAIGEHLEQAPSSVD